MPTNRYSRIPILKPLVLALLLASTFASRAAFAQTTQPWPVPIDSGFTGKHILWRDGLLVLGGATPASPTGTPNTVSVTVGQETVTATVNADTLIVPVSEVQAVLVIEDPSTDSVTLPGATVPTGLAAGGSAPAASPPGTLSTRTFTPAVFEAPKYGSATPITIVLAMPAAAGSRPPGPARVTVPTVSGGSCTERLSDVLAVLPCVWAGEPASLLVCPGYTDVVAVPWSTLAPWMTTLGWGQSASPTMLLPMTRQDVRLRYTFPATQPAG